MMAELIVESTSRLSLMESTVLGRKKLLPEEEQAALDYVVKNADFTAYHLLFALRDRSEALYQSIPAVVRTAVLCAALSQLTYLNDWGHLAVAPRVGAPARALVEAGAAALSRIEPVLADRRPAPFFGSADATIATQYRRADFAYRAAASILGRKAVFHDRVEKRDAAIASLKSDRSTQ